MGTEAPVRWTARQLDSPMGNPAAWGARFEIFTGDGTSADSLFVAFALDPEEAELIAAAPELADALAGLLAFIRARARQNCIGGTLPASWGPPIAASETALRKAGRLP